MLSTDLSDRLQLAREVAREAGDITLDFFRRHNLAVELKHDRTPVTAADRDAERHLRQRIAAAFPGDGLLGEELGERPGDSGFRWILDPIDGTKSFVAGVPLYGTLVGVEQEGDSVLGVIHLPALGETVYAAVGQGAWHVRGAGAPVEARVSCISRLAEGLFCTSELRTFDATDRRQAFERLHAASRLSRTWGDCFGYVLVATGRAELMVDPQMDLWDSAALKPILEEAGGTFTDWRGRPTIHAGEAIATNRHILAEVLSLVA